MAKIPNPWECDVCHIHKKESNHWWKVFVIDGGAVVLGWDDEYALVLRSWSVESANAHVCGVPHLLEWLSKNVLEVKS